MPPAVDITVISMSGLGNAEAVPSAHVLQNARAVGQCTVNVAAQPPAARSGYSPALASSVLPSRSTQSRPRVRTPVQVAERSAMRARTWRSTALL